jgi:hypothetical protein
MRRAWVPGSRLLHGDAAMPRTQPYFRLRVDARPHCDCASMRQPPHVLVCDCSALNASREPRPLGALSIRKCLEWQGGLANSSLVHAHVPEMDRYNLPVGRARPLIDSLTNFPAPERAAQLTLAARSGGGAGAVPCRVGMKPARRIQLGKNMHPHPARARQLLPQISHGGDRYHSMHTRH